MTITNTVTKNLRLFGSVLADPKQIEKDRRIVRGYKKARFW